MARAGRVCTWTRILCIRAGSFGTPPFSFSETAPRGRHGSRTHGPRAHSAPRTRPGAPEEAREGYYRTTIVRFENAAARDAYIEANRGFRIATSDDMNLIFWGNEIPEEYTPEA